MEEAERPVIPTLSKAKIATKLSYPVGAEQISSALASSAQFQELRLHFYVSMSDHAFRRGHYEFLRIEYLNNARPAEKWPITSLYKRPPQYRWEIVVQPVPRLLRNAVRQYIINSALPRIAQWLAERATLRQQGNDILAFFYDEKTKEFVARQLTQLEPLRDQLTILYGPPPDCKRVEVGRRSSLRKCIRPATEGVIGERLYVWKKPNITVQVGTEFATKPTFKGGLAETPYFVTVDGTDGSIGKTGRGLKLGDSNAAISRIYGTRYVKKGRRVTIQWETTTTLEIGWDEQGLVNHMELLGPE